MATTTRPETRPDTTAAEAAVRPVAPAIGAQLLRRGVAVVGLAGIVLVHVLDATGKFHETPYLGWMYVALIAGCFLVAGMLIERDDNRGWAGALALSVLAFAAYALSRTTGLPSAKDDIGNWFEPLGLSTLFAEAVVALISIRALTGRAHRRFA